MAAAVCLLSLSPAAAQVSVTAKLDSASMLMGSLTTLSLEVVQNKGTKGGFPLIQGAEPQQGYVGVCGDSVELRTAFKIDTVELGSGRIQLNYSVPVQAFDSGTYRLPEFVYVAGSDSARSNALTLQVYPMNVTVDDDIAGLAPVADPEGKKFLDAVPDWMFDYWWVIIALLLAIAAGLWALRRYKKEGTVLRKAPQPTPYEAAVKALAELKAKKLWEQGMEKEYFTELTDILRVYLDRRFGINALEMTSRQIMETLRNNPIIKDKRDYVRRLLDIADFVKFAKVRPLPADNIAAYDNAVSFVEETHALGAAESEVGNLAQELPHAPKTKKGGES